ncbi:Trk K+ transport system NAD-binding subunit [Bradyrhizobium japonicum]|uniref:Uncharacterized protein n=1 Tax=Bradyrhizobium diazoefficiens TaxID=1355477 RepID=A0A810A3S5_9BRAD|nr:Trk K+ transport system NAD-binding subunit [Bradyrhizobium japonicum]BBZ97110.1 hypothetical protein F07S3_69430 [Bradyrhizobium diazoefficiens]BCA06172.1 hypothetical protein H12S4_70760 [Bradyrhizobium diazoefficiens]BCA14799.1 hypothetical protein BDHF08_66460 [Bradyrhizobium diazoefficiens]BCA23524.1 hypothetical protein BDHH15_67390 [Bradyrhizobium diazoefficiens]
MLALLRPVGKGKASALSEFGVKTSIVTTNSRAPGGQFVLHAKAPPGNPYDGHTLAEARRLRCHQTRAPAAIRHRARPAAASGWQRT